MVLVYERIFGFLKWQHILRVCIIYDQSVHFIQLSQYGNTVLIILHTTFSLLEYLTLF